MGIFTSSINQSLNKPNNNNKKVGNPEIQHSNSAKYKYKSERKEGNHLCSPQIKTEHDNTC